MNAKRWFMASLVVFAALFAMEYVIHSMWLAPYYEQTASIWRKASKIQELFPFMLGGQALFAFVFTYIFAVGFDMKKSGLGQGMRFGTLIALLIGPTSALMWYTILPVSGALAMKWGVAGLVEMYLLGIVAGLTYKA